MIPARIAARCNHNLLAALHDGVMAWLSFHLAFYIRLSESQLAQVPNLEWSAAIFTLVSVSVFMYMRLYRGLWRYASMRDLMMIIKSVTLSILIFAVVMFLINRLEGMPRSVFFINWMLMVFMLGGPRFAYRALKDRTLHLEMPRGEGARIPVLLIGAGDHAEQFIRDMARSPRALYEVVAIADDDPGQKGRMIHRIPIYGGFDTMRFIIQKLERKGCRPQKMILTHDRFSGETIRQLLDMADHFGIPLARLPKLSQFRPSVGDKPDIQPIAVEDLLGRSQQVLDRDAMRRLIAGKKVLVTGAGGTIGGELTRQIVSYQPSELILLEISELNLYQIDREIRTAFPQLRLTVILSDIRNAGHIDRIFSDNKPELVFHAAAIKHVPLAEYNIEEAVLTNVFGTRHIAEACHKHGAQAMVMISTDKAVNPTNVMGTSKRLAESFCQALGEAERTASTKFITVRFGNVLGSTGSVVPLFQEQLSRGGPLTVTHPEMTRYFMTVREAVELVLQAAVLGVAMKEKQYIFVLDMGQPMKIVDLAAQMIKLAGLRPGEDIKIVFTGLRPGEKLHEELFHLSENAVKTTHDNIFLASPRSMDLAALQGELDTLLAACHARNTGEVLALLKRLVPDFNHDPRYPAA
jgi:FlaA1/EpsC-like NDP-sugar epimerase